MAYREHYLQPQPPRLDLWTPGLDVDNPIGPYVYDPDATPRRSALKRSSSFDHSSGRRRESARGRLGRRRSNDDSMPTGRGSRSPSVVSFRADQQYYDQRARRKARLDDEYVGLDERRAPAKRQTNSRLFVDPDFGTDPRERTLTKQYWNDPNIIWLRPHELCARPVLLGAMHSRGTSRPNHRNDILQGEIGDCWFLSSVAAAANKSDLLSKVILDPAAPLYGKEYTGKLRFRFWRFGDWTNVVIDDQLPCHPASRNSAPTLLYAKSRDESEFWIALLEKAYAKINGCSYNNLEGGAPEDALTDLTGGVATFYDLNDKTKSREQMQVLYGRLKRCARQSGCLITCGTEGDWREEGTEMERRFGLISGHAYSVTGVTELDTERRRERLIRVCNPFGNEVEWKGRWNDFDTKSWGQVEPKVRKEFMVKRKADGEFWMAYGDFVRYFEDVTICTLGPDYDADGVADETTLDVKMMRAMWRPGISDGGCRNNVRRFATNPQFVLMVKPNAQRALKQQAKPKRGSRARDRHRSSSSSDSDVGYRDNVPPIDMAAEEQGCAVLVSLMQCDYYSHHNQRRNGGLQIGFVVFELTDDEMERLDASFFFYEDGIEVASSGSHCDQREVTATFFVDPRRISKFVVIPSTFEPEQPGKFLLRVYSEGQLKLKLLPAVDGSSDADPRQTQGHTASHGNRSRGNRGSNRRSSSSVRSSKQSSSCALM